jgi:hypothetical protein
MPLYHYDITDLQDLYKTKTYLFNEAIKSMREEVQKGNTIVIVQKYENAPSDVLSQLDSLEELNNWIEKSFPDFNE